jgi:hypothetical protein
MDLELSSRYWTELWKPLLVKSRTELLAKFLKSLLVELCKMQLLVETGDQYMATDWRKRCEPEMRNESSGVAKRCRHDGWSCRLCMITQPRCGWYDATLQLVLSAMPPGPRIRRYQVKGIARTRLIYRRS